MSDEQPLNSNNSKPKFGADNTPVEFPSGLKTQSQTGLTDRTGWIIIGTMLIGGCCLLILLAIFFSKTLPTPAKPFQEIQTAFVPSPLPRTRPCY